MSAEMIVTFPGDRPDCRKVTAHWKGFEIATDQPEASGGDGSAPSPYDLFLASVGTCAGYYVLRFCQQRDLPTDGLRIVQSWERDEDKRLSRIRLEVEVPEGFPEKYHKALVRAADQCAVKRSLVEPPEVVTEVVAS